MAGGDPNRITFSERVAEYPPHTDPIIKVFVLALLSVVGGGVFGVTSALAVGLVDAAPFAILVGGLVGLLLSPIPAVCLRRTRVEGVVYGIGVPTAAMTALGGIVGTVVNDVNTGLTWSVMLSIGTYVVTTIAIGGLAVRGFGRADRRARGLCVCCGYDRWGLDGPCPECGSPPKDSRCKNCGYNRIGIERSAPCPECGTPVISKEH